MAGKNTDGIISRYLNRKVSAEITRFIIDNNINCTPNSISVISFLIGILAFPFYVFRIPWLAGLLVQLSSIIDGVDGELARIKKLNSSYGAFLDTMLDRFANIVILMGASIYVSQTKHVSFLVLLIVVSSAIAGDLMVSYLHSTGNIFGSHPVLVGKIGGIASRDVRLFVIFIFSLFDWVFISLIIIAIISNFYVVAKFTELLYIYRPSSRDS